MPQIDPSILLFAGNLLSNAGGGQGFGNSLGGALTGAGQALVYRQEAEAQRRRDLIDAAESAIGIRAALLELQKDQRAQEAARAQAQHQEAYIAGLDPEDQALARANFADFSEQQSRAAARDPLKVVGRSLVDTDAEGGAQSIFTAPPNPQVAITNQAESERAKGLARLEVQRIEKGYAQADNARAQLGMVEQLAELNSAAFTGPLANIGLKLGQLAQAGGFNIEGVPESEQFNAISNQLALRIRNPESGGGLTGSTSNRDLTFLINSIPNLTQTREGRANMINALNSSLQRNVQAAEARAEYLEERGNLRGFDKWVEENLPPAPDILDIAGFGGVRQRMRALGVDMDDINFTMQTNPGVSIEQILDYLEAQQ